MHPLYTKLWWFATKKQTEKITGLHFPAACDKIRQSMWNFPCFWKDVYLWLSISTNQPVLPPMPPAGKNIGWRKKREEENGGEFFLLSLFPWPPLLPLYFWSAVSKSTTSVPALPDQTAISKKPGNCLILWTPSPMPGSKKHIRCMPGLTMQS